MLVAEVVSAAVDVMVGVYHGSEENEDGNGCGVTAEEPGAEEIDEGGM